MTIKAKRRALYLYECSKCHKKRSSRVYKRASDRVCAICRRNQVPDNQQSLFKEIDDMITDGVNKSPNIKI